MSEVTIGVIGIIALFVFLAFKVPVAFSMLIVGVAGYSFLRSPTAGLSLFGSDIFANLTSFSMTAIPMFVMAGALAFAAGMGERILNASNAIAGRLRGSLCISVTIACAFFGALCGSSAATAATMGKIALPAMRKFKYDVALSTGAIAAAGTLASMIPPSNLFIIYALLTDQSIGKMFIAGILPGILLTILFALTVYLLCLRKPALAPLAPSISAKEKLEGVVGVVEVVVLFILVIGGLFLGWFSATQGGAILVFGIFIISLARRTMTRKSFINGLKDTAKTSSMILLILFAALIFGRFVAASKLPMYLAGLFSVFEGSPLALLIIIMIFYAIGGMFMDGMALVTVSLPIIFPTVVAMGWDPIWFGVLLCANGELGMITPPVGINVFVLKGVAGDIPLSTMFRGIVPFCLAIVVCLAILIAFPQISLFLPSFMSY